MAFVLIVGAIAALAAAYAYVQQDGSSKVSRTASYRSVVPYDQNSPLIFPDFTLTFIGTSEGAHLPGSTVRMGDTYHFVAATPAESVPVVWSAGTGMVAPSTFRIGGHAYTLERASSEHAGGDGWLKDNELVVSPETVSE